VVPSVCVNGQRWTWLLSGGADRNHEHGKPNSVGSCQIGPQRRFCTKPLTESRATRLLTS
jgi:hypothetical protein